MKTSMQATRGNETVAGWVIEFATGRRQFMTGITQAGALRTADQKAAEGQSVRWVRAFTMSGDVRVILA